MTNLDWVIVAITVVSALGGYRRGLIGTAFWLVGLVAGAVLGARLAPHVLSGGTDSRYTALIGLLGAVVGVGILQMIASLIARTIRGGLHLVPPLHLLDSLGGLAVGAVWGLALCWVVGAVALQIPGYPKVRKDVRHSEVLRKLNRVAPPHDVLLVQKKLTAVILSRLESAASGK